MTNYYKEYNTAKKKIEKIKELEIYCAELASECGTCYREDRINKLNETVCRLEADLNEAIKERDLQKSATELLRREKEEVIVKIAIDRMKNETLVELIKMLAERFLK